MSRKKDQNDDPAIETDLVSLIMIVSIVAVGLIGAIRILI